MATRWAVGTAFPQSASADDGAPPSDSTRATIVATAATRRPPSTRRDRAPSPDRDSGEDEGVDGNGREQQREIEVGQTEQPDRALGCGVAPELLGAEHEPNAQHARGDAVQRSGVGDGDE